MNALRNRLDQTGANSGRPRADETCNFPPGFFNSRNDLNGEPVLSAAKQSRRKAVELLERTGRHDERCVGMERLERSPVEYGPRFHGAMERLERAVSKPYLIPICSGRYCSTISACKEKTRIKDGNRKIVMSVMPDSEHVAFNDWNGAPVLSAAKQSRRKAMERLERDLFLVSAAIKRLERLEPAV